MNQPELLLSGRKKQDVSDELIGSRANFKEALKLAKECSRLNDLQLAQELEIDPAQWSRIWSDRGHFPVEKLKLFMDLCENEIPLRWLALKYGYELRPLKSQLELENETLRAQVAQQQHEMETIKRFMSEIRGR